MTWYRISEVNGRSVWSAYGLRYLYAPTRMFQGMVIRALGVYVDGAAWNAGLLDSYASTVGRMPAMALTYHDWASNGDLGQLFPQAMIDSFTERGVTPILSWAPWDWNGEKSQPTYRLSRIVAGDFDDYIKGWAESAKSYGKTLFIRFAYEMNLPQYPWGAGVNGNTSDQFVAAWRHVVDVFRAVGATNVRWIWSPNVEYGADFPFAPFYPGDAYVDWVALDGYNWGLTRIGWESFGRIFGGSYADLVALAPGKPILVAETASTEAGGDKASWIRDAFLEAIPTHYPRIAGVIWFNQSKETSWPVTSSAAALDAFRSVVATATWQGQIH